MTTWTDFGEWLFDLNNLKTQGIALAKANGWDNGPQGREAVLHIYTSAMITLRHGPSVAKWLGDYRERGSSSGNADWRADTYKDLYNNQIGIKIAQYVIANDLPITSVNDLVIDALESGQGIWIYRGTKLPNGTYLPKDGRIPLSFSGDPADFNVDPNYSGPVLHIKSAGGGTDLTLTYDEVMALVMQNMRCFPSDTPIQTSLTSTTLIADLRVGDIVLAFDPAAELGRGALVPRRVTKLFRNVTTVWVKLEWRDPVTGEARELVATPGHHFLDQFGNFPPIDQMIRDGRADVVLASGDVVTVTATRIVYSAVTAHLFEQATAQAVAAGNTALAPQPLDGWATYNFEVEDVHNLCGRWRARA